jgi:hypothetical protein
VIVWVGLGLGKVSVGMTVNVFTVAVGMRVNDLRFIMSAN